MSIKKQFTLGAAERLKSRKLIERLFNERKSFHVGPFRVLYLFLEENTTRLQAGFSVSSKNFKRAVDRNRIKRLMKEGWRLQKNELSATLERKEKHLIVFVIYTSKELPDHQPVQEKLMLIIKKLIAAANEDHSSHT